jgi:hypothetical protein
MQFDIESAGLDPEKLVTRSQLADLVRERLGIPLTKSRIEKDSALGCGPKVTAIYGRCHLITVRDGFAWAVAKARLIEPAA